MSPGFNAVVTVFRFNSKQMCVSIAPCTLTVGGMQKTQDMGWLTLRHRPAWFYGISVGDHCS